MDKLYTWCAPINSKDSPNHLCVLQDTITDAPTQPACSWMSNEHIVAFRSFDAATNSMRVGMMCAGGSEGACGDQGLPMQHLNDCFKECSSQDKDVVERAIKLAYQKGSIEHQTFLESVRPLNQPCPSHGIGFDVFTAQ